LRRKKLINYVNKFLLTVLLTLLMFILVKKNSSFKTNIYKYLYEDNISFAQINNMYKKYFGSQIPFESMFNKTKTVFNQNLNYTSKKPYFDGVELEVSDNYLVPIIETGMVVFVGKKENYGDTVIIQQVNGIDVWYSNVDLKSVKLYDYLEKGTSVFQSNSTKIYLLFKNNGKILNYEDYI